MAIFVSFSTDSHGQDGVRQILNLDGNTIAAGVAEDTAAAAVYALIPGMLPAVWYVVLMSGTGQVRPYSYVR